MKKALLIFSGIIIFILIILAIVPLIFKDDIKARVTKEVNKNVRAEVYFEDIRLSLFRNFPNVTASLDDFGVVGVDQFAGDTLADIESFRVVIDLGSLIFDDQIQVNRVELNQPEIMVLVLEDGTANYDIAVSEEEPQEETDEAAEFNVSVDSWEINDGHIGYYDMSSNLMTEIKGLNHTGSGDFTQDIFDLVTHTFIASFSLSFEDVSYMSNQEIEADMNLLMNMPESKYTFQQNNVRINDFNFGFEGEVAMPGEDINMDITFASEDNSLKSLLSMIPGVFLEGYENIETQGNLQFDGFVEGTYNDSTEQMPAYKVNLAVSNGVITYPDLPSPITNINFTTLVENKTGQMADALIQVNDLTMDMDEQQFVASLWLKNLDNYQWNVSANGSLDLGNLVAFMEMDEMQLEGIITADIQSKGSMDALEAERYEDLPTSGTFKISNFYYESEDLPQGFTISDAAASINPERMTIDSFDGKVGTSDMQINGYVANYIAYIMADDVISGNMTLNSKQFNVNEWMTDDEEDAEEADTTELQVVKIPENIDFVFNSTINEVIYDNLTLNDLTGTVMVQNSIVSLENLRFTTLDGNFTMNGTYNTQDIEAPLFNFEFNIENLAISSAFQNFNTIQALAPIAQNVNGKFSTNFTLGGELEQNMMPDYSTLVGQGLIELANAAVRDSKIISGITNLTQLKDTDEVTLKDVVLNAEIKNGRIYVDPFDFSLGNIQSTVYGSNGVDGSLDYIVNMAIPAGQIGQTINQAIASLSGSNQPVSSTVKVNFKVGGTYNDPKIAIAGTEAGESTAEQAKKALKDQVEEKKEEINEEVKDQIDAKKEEVEEELKKEKEKAEEEVKEKVEEEVDKAKEKLKKFFKRGGGGGE